MSLIRCGGSQPTARRKQAGARGRSRPSHGRQPPACPQRPAGSAGPARGLRAGHQQWNGRRVDRTKQHRRPPILREGGYGGGDHGIPLAMASSTTRPEALLQRWKGQHIGDAIKRRHVRLRQRPGDDDGTGRQGARAQGMEESLPIAAVVEQGGTPGDDQLALRAQRTELDEGFQQRQRVLALLDATNGKDDRPGPSPRWLRNGPSRLSATGEKRVVSTPLPTRVASRSKVSAMRSCQVRLTTNRVSASTMERCWSAASRGSAKASM